MRLVRHTESLTELSRSEGIRQTEHCAVAGAATRPKPTGSIGVVRESLRLLEGEQIPDDADGTLAAHIQELERRVRRLRKRGGALATLRLTPEVLKLRTVSQAAAQLRARRLHG